MIVGDVNPLRLAHAKAVGFETADLSTRRSAARADRQPSSVSPKSIAPSTRSALKRAATAMTARSTRPGHGAQLADGNHPGRRQDRHPRTVCDGRSGRGRQGRQASAALSIRFGLGWAKSHSFHTGQTPVMKYNRALMQAIMWDRIKIAEVVGVQVISARRSARAATPSSMPARRRNSSSIRTSCLPRPKKQVGKRAALSCPFLGPCSSRKPTTH